jgi:AcrR family transcriptional regulator
MAKASLAKRRREGVDAAAVRDRILEAAFAVFTKNGYAASSTLEIATRAHVSKRELYALVGNKQQMLIACINERSKRLQVPAELRLPRDRQTLAHVLASFGTQLLREISDPTVIAVFRLAIAEAVYAPEVAQALNSIGCETGRAALRKIMAHAQASNLLKGHPADLADQFTGLLWRDLLVSLLLGIAKRPPPREIARRAQEAAASFLQLHAPAIDTASLGRMSDLETRGSPHPENHPQDSQLFEAGQVGHLSDHGAGHDQLLYLYEREPVSRR